MMFFEALRPIFAQLVARMQPDDIVDKLYQSKLLTPTEYEGLVKDISEKSDFKGVNRRILMAVSKGPERSVDEFVGILKTSQPDLAHELLRASFVTDTAQGPRRSSSDPAITMSNEAVLLYSGDDHDVAQAHPSLSLSNQPLLSTIDAATALSRRELEEAQRIATQKKPLEQLLRKRIAKLEDENKDLMDKTTHLQGELAENHRVSEANRDNLVAAIVQRRLAEKERDEFEVKFQQAFRQIGNLKSEVDEAKKQLKDLEVTNLHLQGQLTESHRVEEVNRKELEAARLQKFAADTEMNKAEAEMKRAKAETKLADQRYFEAYNQIDSLRKQAGDSKRQMNELERELEAAQRTATQKKPLEQLLRKQIAELEDNNQDLMRKLEEAQKVIEHERTEEAQLRQTIAELEDGNKGLMRELEEAQRIATQKKPLEQQLRKQIAELKDNNQDLMRKLEEAQKVIEHERTEEAQLRQTIAELESGNKSLMETNLRLKGQLTESHRVEEVNRNDLEAARLHRNAAEVGRKTAEAEKKRAEEKCLKAFNEMDSLRKRAEDTEKQLNMLNKAHTCLKDEISDLRKEQSSYQDDLETTKDKLHESQKYAEELEQKAVAEREQRISSDFTTWLTQHLNIQDIESSPEPAKTDLHTIMEIFKEIQSHLQEECERLKGDVVAHKCTIEGKVEELQKCKASMYDMNRSMTALSADKSNLEKRLAEEKANMYDMNRSMAALSADKSNLEKRLAEEKRLHYAEVTRLEEDSKQLKVSFELQRQQLLNQLDEESRLKSKADASNETLRNKVTMLEQAFQREKERHESTRHNHETAKAVLTAVNLKLQEKETELAEKIKDYYLMEDGQLELQTRIRELECHLAVAQKELTSLQAAIEAAERELAVLRRALVQKTASFMNMEEENRRLRENQMDQRRIKRQRQILKQGQVDVQRVLQEVMEEKAKLNWGHNSEEQVKKAMETLQTLSKEKRDEMTQEQERATERALSTFAAASQEHVDTASRKFESFISQMKEEQAASITKKHQHCLKFTDQEAQLEMEAAPVLLASDVAEQTDDERLLQHLCYMATGIKQICISPDGGTFKLGSADASLKFPKGAVQKETLVRYAIILHGPFIFPAGYKPGSVVVYLNTDGATLMKPFLLHLSHWCIREKGDDGDTLKFLRAPHTLKAGQRKYIFDELEEESDLTTCTNVGVLTIQGPQCLFCVEAKIETIARYSAISFSQYIPSEDTLLFRIQLMCDSLFWNEHLTIVLQQQKWRKTSNAIAQFQFANHQRQITAKLRETTGPGWEADIDGHCAVIEEAFLTPKGKSTPELEQEIISGRYPPSILSKVIYTSSEEKRTKRAMMKVDVNGANVPLIFSCIIKEMSTPSLDVAGHSSLLQADINYTADVIIALNHQLDAQWREFGTFLHVERAIMDGIYRDTRNVGECMLILVEKWLGHDNKTGDLPRTWKTVGQAVKNMGRGLLAEQLTQQHGEQLPGQ